MRKLGRFLAVEVALLAVLGVPRASRARQSALIPEQSGLETGTIVVDEKSAGQLLRVPVQIRVRSVAHQVNLGVTVESISIASFDELPAGDYVIQITASGYQAAQVSVPLAGGEVVKIAVGVIEGEPASFSLRLTSSALTGAADQARMVAPLLLHENTNTVKGVEANACPLEKVMLNTSKRLEEFVGNVNRISAIEVLEHERLDKHGKVLEHEKHQFNYVAIIEETLPGALNVDEYRDGAVGANGSFPHDIATVGMPSLAMIFHPYHLDEFKMECDGTAVWREQPVWRVRFEQRKDRPSRMSVFRVGREIFPVLIKGVAWIDAGNYQIVHLETELLEPIPQVKLYTERQALDYGPVQFQDSKMSLWLPQAAEIYLDSGGRHFHHRHTYSKYQLFSVEVGQKIGSPK